MSGTSRTKSNTGRDISANRRDWRARLDFIDSFVEVYDSTARRPTTIRTPKKSPGADTGLYMTYKGTSIFGLHLA